MTRNIGFEAHECVNRMMLEVDQLRAEIGEEEADKELAAFWRWVAWTAMKSRKEANERNDLPQMPLASR